MIHFRLQLVFPVFAVGLISAAPALAVTPAAQVKRTEAVKAEAEVKPKSGGSPSGRTANPGTPAAVPVDPQPQTTPIMLAAGADQARPASAAAAAKAPAAPPQLDHASELNGDLDLGDW